MWIVLHDNMIWYGFNDATMWLTDDATMWLTDIYVYCIMILYDDDMSWEHGDGYLVLQAPMDGPVIEAAYGETMIHSTEAVQKMLAREEWLGCRHDASPMFDILRSTPVWASYMTFSGFHDIKIYMYYVLKSICIIKGTLMVSDFVLARRCSEKVFDCPWVLKKRLIHRYTVVLLRVDIMYCYVYDTAK